MARSLEASVELGPGVEYPKGGLTSEKVHSIMQFSLAKVTAHWWGAARARRPRSQYTPGHSTFSQGHSTLAEHRSQHTAHSTLVTAHWQFLDNSAAVDLADR